MMADPIGANGRSPRIPLPAPEEMSEEQRRVYDEVIAGPRGTIVGPLRAVIHSPGLADCWQKLGAYVRYNTVLPEHLKELAILITARRWNSQLEWTIHRPIAERAGLSETAICTLRDGTGPALEKPEEREIYQFVRELQMSGQVSDTAYGPVLRRWGDQGIVELTAIVGYYTMVAMMLNAHHIPLPEGTEPDLEADASLEHELSTLPPLGAGAKAEAEPTPDRP